MHRADSGIVGSFKVRDKVYGGIFLLDMIINLFDARNKSKLSSDPNDMSKQHQMK